MHLVAVKLFNIIQLAQSPRLPYSLSVSHCPAVSSRLNVSVLAVTLFREKSSILSHSLPDSLIALFIHGLIYSFSKQLFGIVQLVSSVQNCSIHCLLPICCLLTFQCTCGGIKSLSIIHYVNNLQTYWFTVVHSAICSRLSSLAVELLFLCVGWTKSYWLNAVAVQLSGVVFPVNCLQRGFIHRLSPSLSEKLLTCCLPIDIVSSIGL